MNHFTSIELWNWFHAMYLTFIFDLILFDILVILILAKCLSNVKPILYLMKNGGFFTVKSNNFYYFNPFYKI